MKVLTILFLLLPALSLAQQPSAKAAWSWVTQTQGQKAPPCKECGKNCTCAPCTCSTAKKSWPCDVCGGTGRGGLCTNCDGTGKVDYDPAKDGPLAVKKGVATLVIELPPTAQLWIQGEQQYGTGETRRVFQSPPLEEGKAFFYTVKVKDVFGKEESATVEVKAGRVSRVSFTRLPAVQMQNWWPGFADPSCQSGR